MQGIEKRKKEKYRKKRKGKRISENRIEKERK